MTDKCACPNIDRYECLDRRYNLSQESEWERNEGCTCACHDEVERDENGERWIDRVEL